jgi:hypothetical protein
MFQLGPESQGRWPHLSGDSAQLDFKHLLVCHNAEAILVSNARQPFGLAAYLAEEL